MKPEKKGIIIGLAIGIIVTLFYSHFFAPRYEIKKEGSMIKMDRWTGQSWILINDQWKKMVNRDQDWEEIDKVLARALKIPFAQVNSELALKKLKEANPVLKNIPDDELLERIKLVYSKIVLVNTYLREYLLANSRPNVSQPQEAAGNNN